MTDAGVPTAELLDVAARYDGILFDAYGVLVTHSGALPGAAEHLRALDERGIPWLVVTNDASRHPERAAAWYRELGLPVPEERVVSSGALLGGWIRQRSLEGRPVLVLGTPDSERMIVEGGARAARDDEPFDGAALCDEAGYPLLAGLERLLNAKLLALEAGRRLPLALANPDIVYPQRVSSSGQATLGIAVGGLATLLEAAVRSRVPDAPAPLFDRLGKPHAPIFDEAKRRLGSTKLLMVGDQLATDVRGALDAGLDAALVTTGVARAGKGAGSRDSCVPTFLLPGWGAPR